MKTYYIKIVETRSQIVEVHKNKQVGLVNNFVALFLLSLVTPKCFETINPCVHRRSQVGRYHIGLLPHTSQHTLHTKGRPKCIAVGVCMAR